MEKHSPIIPPSSIQNSTTTSSPQQEQKASVTEGRMNGRRVCCKIGTCLDTPLKILGIAAAVITLIGLGVVTSNSKSANPTLHKTGEVLLLSGSISFLATHLFYGCQKLLQHG